MSDRKANNRMGCLLYLVALFVPFLGIIIGAIFYNSSDIENKKIGKIVC